MDDERNREIRKYFKSDEHVLMAHGILGKASELCDAYERQAVDALHSLRHPTAKGLLRRVIGKIFGDGNLIEGYCSEFEARNATGGASRAEPVG